MEARNGDMITTELRPELLSNELIPQRDLKPAVETSVTRLLHVGLSSSAVADTLTPNIADLARTDCVVDILAKIMTTSLVPLRLRPALLTPETLCSISAHLVTISDFKEAIVSDVLPHVHEEIEDIRTALARAASEH